MAFGKTPTPGGDDVGNYPFTHAEIDLLRDCIMRTENYYRGLLLLKQDWNAEKNEQTIAIIKVKLNMIDRLQEKATYIGQSDYYKNMK